MATKKTAKRAGPAKEKGATRRTAKKAVLKTRATAGSVDGFLDAIPDPRRRDEARAVRAMMERVTGEPAVMWGASVVGFGRTHLRYASGRELDWFLVGFSPRKQALVLYVMPGFAEYGALCARLGEFTTGKSCLYVKRLEEVDAAVLEELVARSVADMRARHGG